MMLNTNLQSYYSDLQEVSNQFTDFNKDVTLNYLIEGNKFIVNCEIQGIFYTYSYDYTPKNDCEEKRLTKRYAKLSLYKALVSFTGVKLPWGALTGIRPTKLAYQQGSNFKDFFLNTMLVSQEKTDLIEQILKTQSSVYNVSKGNGNLFVSIPFCPTRCAYCSFISNVISKEKLINGYIDRLIDEINDSKPLIKNLRSVYIGGGTPVALSDKHFEMILNSIGKVGVEYTVEAGRPDAITVEKLKLMKEYGVTRVCVNPQTFQDKTLKLIGRNHTSKDIIDKFYLCKEYGFDVNMDLIAGLPEESYEDFKDTINKAILLSPENITVHTLCLKRGSKLKESCERLADIYVSNMVEYAHSRLAEAGYNPYYLYRQKYMAGNLENTGYCKPNKECIYNIDIMEETTDIIACGANAVSKKVLITGDGIQGKITRLGAPKDTATYIDKVFNIIEEKKSLFT